MVVCSKAFATPRNNFLLSSLMHVKFMHELCSLLLHIPTYLDVIIMFCIDLWAFFHGSPLFGL
jgi:hypothetical protein